MKIAVIHLFILSSALLFGNDPFINRLNECLSEMEQEKKIGFTIEVDEQTYPVMFNVPGAPNIDVEKIGLLAALKDEMLEPFIDWNPILMEEKWKSIRSDILAVMTAPTMKSVEQLKIYSMFIFWYFMHDDFIIDQTAEQFDEAHIKALHEGLLQSLKKGLGVSNCEPGKSHPLLNSSLEAIGQMMKEDPDVERQIPLFKEYFETVEKERLYHQNKAILSEKAYKEHRRLSGGVDPCFELILSDLCRQHGRDRIPQSLRKDPLWQEYYTLAVSLICMVNDIASWHDEAEEGFFTNLVLIKRANGLSTDEAVKDVNDQINCDLLHFQSQFQHFTQHCDPLVQDSAKALFEWVLGYIAIECRAPTRHIKKN